MMPQTHGIVGHEGVGVVVALGEGTESRWKLGNRAGVKWIGSVCRDCEFCKSGTDELHCASQTVSGIHIPGTFQEYCLADGNYVTKIPDEVRDEEAVPILCGGLTAYTACKRSAVKPGQWIVLPGAGGGLGHFAVQYARVMGMRVIAIDTGDNKRELCLSLGAEVFIDFKTTKDLATKVMEITKHGAHGVIVTAASEAAYESAPTFLGPNGTVVAVGFPSDSNIKVGVVPLLLAWKRLNIVGNIVGTSKDVDEALDFAARGLVRPVISEGKLRDVNTWIQKMVDGQVAGRVVLQVTA
ncbi:hypothetical protein QWA68_016336 [Fusarium oxysporum]|nr:hypothetical protein QWA68_016336 [Fusarium oxysporum]